MKFDFHSYYSTLSNSDLIKIVLQKELYQPEAVTIAEAILDKRSITEEERLSAQNSIDETREKWMAAIAKRQSLVTSVINFLKGLVNDKEKGPSYYVKVFCVGITITVNFIIDYFFSNWRNLISEGPFLFFLIAYIPVMLYFLLNLRKQGWVLAILAFAFGFSDAIKNLFHRHSFINPFFEIHHTVFILLVLFNGICLAFFYRKTTRALFGISSDAFKGLSFVAISIFLFVTFPLWKELIIGPPNK